jgi:hypothetical protein
MSCCTCGEIEIQERTLQSGQWAWGNGQWAWGTGHGAWGMGHGAGKRGESAYWGKGGGA